jgi:hypothetical protein
MIWVVVEGCVGVDGNLKRRGVQCGELQLVVLGAADMFDEFVDELKTIRII